MTAETENTQNEQVENAAPEQEENLVGAEGEQLVEDKVQALEDEIGKLKDTMLREQAELQNQRKRLQRDVENARKFALEKFVKELLSVADNLERAISAAGDDEQSKAIKEGVELTYKSLIDTLAKFDVKQLNPVGEPFDPQFHEAVTMVPNPAMEPDSVMDVLQKGYVLSERLLRAATVVVSK